MLAVLRFAGGAPAAAAAATANLCLPGASLRHHIAAMTEQNHRAAQSADANPFFETWTGPFEVPPFSRIAPKHFMPAFERGFAEHDAEIAAVAGDPAEPTFANTIEAMERAGRLLDRVGSVFGVLSGAHTSDALLKIERELSPRRARHWNGILMNKALFRRIDALFAARERLGLTAEQARVLERYHTQFKRAGAALAPAKKKRLAEINERLASL